MPLNPTSLATAIGASVDNVQFQPEALNVARKILVIGTYDPLKTLVVDDVPVQIFSPEDAGDQFGFGFMLHRLITQAFAGSNGVELWAIPQAEGTPTAAEGTITFTATSATAGTFFLYVAGLAVPVTVAEGDDAATIATATAAAVNAIKELPVTAAAATVVCTLTSKTEQAWANEISIKTNLKAGETLPVGVTIVIVDMTGGVGTPTIADALDGLGTGDNANEAFFTDVVHGYLQDSVTLDAIETYVGAGNTFLGLYAKTVARPFRVLTGDVDTGSAALTALLALGNGRKNDRANGVIAVPGSANHPSEIAAQAIGHMARINVDRAAQSYQGTTLIDIDPGETADRWTSEFDDRDTAVKAGVSPTVVQSGSVVLQNVVTFYHPDSVPVSSNGYRSMRNISIIQNLLANILVNFRQEKWQGISIVNDVNLVTNATDREKARDINSVIGDLIALANSFETKAWIFQAQFTIDKLKEAGAVTIRSGNNGFDNTLSVIFSGEGQILDTEVKFDISSAILF